MPQIEQRERSASEVRAAIGDPRELVLVHGLGNLGDRLILEGTRALLSDRFFREIPLEELGQSEGEVALIVGGGAFSAAYHEWARWALQLAETRFARVIVLPSTFDVSVPEVRVVLETTHALLFARERQSFEAIRELCDARLACDTAFHYDFAPHRRDGSGVLNAFRTDREAPEAFPLPPGNEDISLIAGDLEEWLGAIVARATVRTNRAHVMIAAAMLGKTVEVGPCRSGKLEAIAEYSLPDFPLARIDWQPSVPRLRTATRPVHPRVTAVVIAGERLAGTLAAVESALADPHTTALVLDGVSPPDVRIGLTAAASSAPRVRLRHDGDTELAAIDTDYTLLLDPDVELSDGTTACLTERLDAEPDALAATPTVQSADRGAAHCGGEVREWGEVVDFRLPARARSCDWAPFHALLVRRGAFAQFPLDALTPSAYRDREWAYRIQQRHGDAFRACPDALAVLHSPPSSDAVDTSTFHGRCVALPSLIALARFHARHGRVLRSDLVRVFSSLEGVDASFDLPAARLLLVVLDELGPSRFLALWCEEDLDSVIGAGRLEQHAEAASAEAELARANQRLDDIARSRIWRLAGSYYRARARAVRLAHTLREP